MFVDVPTREGKPRERRAEAALRIFAPRLFMLFQLQLWLRLKVMVATSGGKMLSLSSNCGWTQIKLFFFS